MPHPRFIPLLAAATLLLACTAGTRTTYTGTYVRTWLGSDGHPAQVSGTVRLVLDDRGNYRLESAASDTPPSGAGRYTREGNALILADLSPVTAGFDLSLILDGTFEVAESERGMVLRQENVWGDTHVLLLERVEP